MNHSITRLEQQEMTMIGTLIGIIFLMIILGVVWWAAQKLMGLKILVIIVFWVLITLLGMAGIRGLYL